MAEAASDAETFADGIGAIAERARQDERNAAALEDLSNTLPDGAGRDAVDEAARHLRMQASLSRFQERAMEWALECFGRHDATDVAQRNHRFLEEAIELVQAQGCTRGEAHQLVDYVFGRPAGDPAQEVGGTMLTLAILCLARGIDMNVEAERELARVRGKITQIRAKQARKEKDSPLPGASAKQGDDHVA